jgi:hypothetical protein
MGTTSRRCATSRKPDAVARGLALKHAGPAVLASLEPLLKRLRQDTPLVERTPGSFYLKAKAYLHFHEDPAGIFADVKLDGAGFTRLPATTAQEQAHLLALVAAHLAR